MLGDIFLDKLQENIGHVLPLGGRCRLETGVQTDLDVDIHSFRPRSVISVTSQSGPAALEVSIYINEYRCIKIPVEGAGCSRPD